MTERIVTALANPFCTMLGHSSGRLLLAREPYAHDLEAILKFAGAHQVIMGNQRQPLPPGPGLAVAAPGQGIGYFNQYQPRCP